MVAAEPLLAKRIRDSLHIPIGRNQHHIETDPHCAMARIPAQPDFRRGKETLLLARRQGKGGFTQAGARFHFDEGEERVLLDDQIEFARRRALPCGEDPPSICDERITRDRLSRAAEAIGTRAAQLAGEIRQPAPRGWRSPPRGS